MSGELVPQELSEEDQRRQAALDKVTHLLLGENAVPMTIQQYDAMPRRTPQELVTDLERLEKNLEAALESRRSVES